LAANGQEHLLEEILQMQGQDLDENMTAALAA